MISTLMGIPSDDFSTWLQNERSRLHLRHGTHGPESQASISLSDFRSHARTVFEDDSTLDDDCYDTLYRIAIASGTFPFPSYEDTTLNTEVLVTCISLLRPKGIRAIGSPGYYYPREQWKDATRSEARRRHSRENLRFIFQTLATDDADGTLRANETKPDSNEDLLDTLAVSMDLDDECKLAYYPSDFKEAIAALPSSMSDRKLDCFLSWKKVESLLKIFRLTERQEVEARASKQPLPLSGFGVFEADVKRLLKSFQSHEQSVSEGATWPCFYKTMEAIGYVHGPEDQDRCRVYGKCSQSSQPHALAPFNSALLRICESLRVEYSSSPTS